MKFLMLALFYFQKLIFNNFVLFSKKTNYYLSIKKLSGYDERPHSTINETEKQIFLYQMQKNFEKKKLLDILQNDNVCLHKKMELLENNSITSPNLMAGGLRNDF